MTWAALDPLVDLVVRRATAPAVRRPVVLVDGRSGSGKTTFARALRAAWPGPVQLVHLDDVYPGWHGLEAASRTVEQGLLATAEPGWTTWDWSASAPGPRRRLDPGRALVVEGAGSLTRGTAAAATVSVWLELDTVERRRRALARDGDGDGYEPWWDVWAEQEERHLRREDPVGRASVVAGVVASGVTARPRR